MFLVSNYEPKLSSEDGAAWQRITTIPFNVKIRGTSIEIPGLPIQLKSAADAVLTWAVQGLEMFYEHGLAAPQAVLSRTAAYQAKVDEVTQFITTQLTATGDPSSRVPRTEVWQEWLTWAKAEGAESVKQSDFYAKVAEHYSQGKVAGVRVFRGLALAPSQLIDEDAVLDDD